MQAHIRKWYPGIRLLLAYSDPSQGHRGTVYEADGWNAETRTKGFRPWFLVQNQASFRGFFWFSLFFPKKDTALICFCF
jgi:hypothetical protein